MDNSRRLLFKRLGQATLATGLIPLSEIALAAPKHADGMAGKRWGMLIDMRRCVGCQACTVACTIENQPPLGVFRTTVNQYEVSNDDSLDSPAAFVMLPRLCNHCETPACLPVCPTGATYQRDDGIVVVNNEWCVGCGYCVQACPYDARFINEETNTADKCTFCAHRLEAGLLPACVETCVGGARVIGDLNDSNSEIRQLLKENQHDISVLKPEENTKPCVFYIGLSDYFAHTIEGEQSVRTLMEDNGEIIARDS